MIENVYISLPSSVTKFEFGVGNNFMIVFLNSTVFKLTDMFILYFFIQDVHANKKLLKKKGYKIM